jgi:tight adherence protein B
VSALPWVALAGAVVLLPAPMAARPRAVALAARGRLAAPAPATRSRHRARRRGLRAPLVPVRSLALAACVKGALVVGSVAGVGLGVASVVAVAMAGWLARSAHLRRRRQRRLVELLAGLRVLVAELESGSRPAAALHAAGASAPSFGTIFDRAASAATASGQVAAALHGAAQPELRPLAHGWSVAERCGAPLANTVARVVEDLAARLAQQRAVGVVLAGPRASAVLLAGLPVLGIALGTAMGARPGPFLLTTSSGHGVFAVGVLLEAAGLLWTARLIARAERV